METMITIYLITCLPNGRQYVGLTSDLYRRWNDHVSGALRGNGPNRMLGAAIRKYGREAFTVETLCVAKNLIEACSTEQYMIAFYKTLAPAGMNLTAGGEGTVAFHKTHSAETKAKISAAHKGRIVSEETRHKMSIAKKGVRHTLEARMRMGDSHRGKKHSVETKKKFSDVKYAYWKRRKAEHPRSTTVKHSGETGIYWDVRRQSWSIEVQVDGKKHRATRCKELVDAIISRDALRVRIGWKPDTSRDRRPKHS